MVKKLSVVIPVFNNSESLFELHQKIVEELRNLKEIAFELIYVDDGSSDNSWMRIIEIHYTQPTHVVGIRLSRNFGQLAAMIAGWESSSGDAVINISADLQDPPAMISQFVIEWLNGKDLVIGVRNDRKDRFTSRITSTIATWLLRRSNPEIPETWFDFTLVSRRVLNILISLQGRHRFTQGDMLYAGFERGFIPYTRAKRVHGRSGYNFRRRVKNFVDSMLDSSQVLIHTFEAFGFVLIFGSIVTVTAMVVAVLTSWAVPVLILLMYATLLMISGVLILMSGISLEYQWRIYDTSRKKPVYVVRSSTRELSPASE